jgi:hypothetical protein
VHRELTRRRRGQDGAVAIIVAISLTVLLVGVALVLDFGLVKVDRQVDKSGADAATTAGLHGLNGGDGLPHPYAGVCSAIRYLKQNGSRFSNLPEGAGWTNGLGGAVGNGCTNPALLKIPCNPDDKSTWAKYTWSGTYSGEPFQVIIQSGYLLTGSTGWSEDSLSASQADTGDPNQKGCDNLAVSVTQNRKPGLGSLATSSDLVSSVRSVGRVEAGPGGDAPAMLILDRHGCEVLSSTSAGLGSGSFVHVNGFYSSTTTLSQGGSIHADSDAADCSSASHHNIFYGSAANTIVAYAAPTSSGGADASKPGLITSVAGANGVALSTIRDDGDNVYASQQLSGSAPPHLPPLGRDLVTRKPVDDRYLATAKTAMQGAYNAVFSKAASYFTVPNGWKKIASCTPTAAELSLTPSDKVYVACNTNSGYSDTRPIKAGVVAFSGKVAPPNISGTSVSLPNATNVYVFGRSGTGILFGNNGEFTMHTSSLLANPPQCSSSLTSNKATLFVWDGNINGNGGTLQLCNTTVFMMSAHSDGCAPSTSGTAPTSSPCSGTPSLGDGQIDLHGSASVDWTAPNALDATIDPATGKPTAAALAGWTDVNGPEDLALWDESSSNTSNKYILGGSGTLHSVGVFMVPNAMPFAVGGGGGQSLINAQYIASDIALNGGAQISMTVDPNAAVTIPELVVVGLVR